MSILIKSLAQPLRRPPAEWRQALPESAVDVLLRGRTERSGTSPLNLEMREGQYVCTACPLPVFSSTARFASGTGWPSFWDCIAGHVETRGDSALLARTEYHGAQCGGHRRHLFSDGSPPTGMRACNNGLALRFVPAGEPLAEPRA